MRVESVRTPAMSQPNQDDGFGSSLDWVEAGQVDILGRNLVGSFVGRFVLTFAVGDAGVDEVAEGHRGSVGADEGFVDNSEGEDGAVLQVPVPVPLQRSYPSALAVPDGNHRPSHPYVVVSHLHPSPVQKVRPSSSRSVQAVEIQGVVGAGTTVEGLDEAVVEGEADYDSVPNPVALEFARASDLPPISCLPLLGAEEHGTAYASLIHLFLPSPRITSISESKEEVH